MRFRSWGTILLVLLVVGLVAGCGSRNTDPAEQPSGVLVPISPLAGYAAHGDAVLAPTNSGNAFTVTVRMQGLTPGLHPEHIHVGVCPKSGAVLYPLTTLNAGSNGTAEATTTVNARLSEVTDGNHSINVHQPDLTPVACGDIPKQ